MNSNDQLLSATLLNMNQQLYMNLEGNTFETHKMGQIRMLTGNHSVKQHLATIASYRPVVTSLKAL